MTKPRYVVVGTGAVGTTIGARLGAAGFPVTAVTRPVDVDRIRRLGLVSHGPEGTTHASVDVVGSIADGGVDTDAVVIITVKTQHVEEVARQLAWIYPPTQRVVAVQNGVAAERILLRRFINTLSAVLTVASVSDQPGVAHSTYGPVAGVVDVGRWPHGSDRTVSDLVRDLTAAGFDSRFVDDIARWKYGKLLRTICHVARAAFTSSDAAVVNEMAVNEAVAHYEASSIQYASDAEFGSRRTPLHSGQQAASTSFQQSLTRRTESVETDYTNGEIALIARLAGRRAPVNEALQRVALLLAHSNAVDIQQFWEMVDEVAGSDQEGSQ